MAYEFHYRRLVHWQDTDLAGIIHYTNYFRYMDEAETEFYRSLGLNKLTDSSAAGVTCPRVSATCDFIKPTVFGDELDVHFWIAKKGRSSIVYRYSFKRGSQAEEVARGRVTCVFSARGSDGKLRSTPIPVRFDRLFEVAPFAESDD